MSEVLSILALFLPLFLILAVANVAERQRAAGEPYQGAALLTYLAIAAPYALAIVMGLALQALGAVVAAQPTLLTDALGREAAGLVDSLPLVGLALWLPALLGILVLLPPVRRLLARILPIDAQSPLHAAALALSMLVLTNLLITLGVGLDNVADLVATEEDGQDAMFVAALWLQQALTALLAMVGVGWLIRHNLPGVLARLGIVMPSRREWAVGIGLGLAMVPAVVLLEGGASLVGLEPDADVERLTEQLLGPLFQSSWGILTLGLSAALGEETMFRGALQPRFGLVLTALLFALVHSNYGLSLSTVVVFLLGLVLGWVRIRYNTTTAMALHAVYNMALGLLALLAGSMLDI